MAVGRFTVREQDRDLVRILWVLEEVSPAYIGIIEVRLMVTLLGMDEVGELGYSRWRTSAPDATPR